MEALLNEIFHQSRSSVDCCESECSLTSALSDGGGSGNFRRRKAAELTQLDLADLRALRRDLVAAVEEMSARLVRSLKNRDRLDHRLTGRNDFVTAILQATSAKRSESKRSRVGKDFASAHNSSPLHSSVESCRVAVMSQFLTKIASTVMRTLGGDAKLKFSLEPPPTPTGFDQWRDAMKAVAKLPDGMPRQFRQRLWLSLANNFLVGVDWEQIRLAIFNERLNPDDHKLGRQIIKDLHRTGWTGLTGEQERSGLKRVLLAYARYNPAVGYCQGFNVIAALILEVMDFHEENAVKVMILLVEKVLPTNYFDQNLRALSVDMAVLRQLLRQRLPRLSGHLDRLQKESICPYEPPLPNVFTMQWFLTLFATCLPQHTVFRVWDSLLLEGSEILLRTGIAIWSRMGRRIYKAQTADEFYCVMGPICQDLLQMSTDQSNELLQTIYSMAEFPYPGLAELRERFTWNVQPLSSTFKLFRSQVQQVLGNEQDDSDSADGFACLAAMKSTDRNKNEKAAEEEKSVDLTALNKQYRHLKQRQEQAAVILQNAYAHGQKRIAANPSLPSGVSYTDGFAVFNHLHFRNTPRGERNVPFSNGIRVSSVTVQPKANGGDQKTVRSNNRTELHSHHSAHPGERRVTSGTFFGPADSATEANDSGSVTPTPTESRPLVDLMDLNSPSEFGWTNQTSVKPYRRRWNSLTSSRTFHNDDQTNRLRRTWSCGDSLLFSHSDRSLKSHKSPGVHSTVRSDSKTKSFPVRNGPDLQSSVFTFELNGHQPSTESRPTVKRGQTGVGWSRADSTDSSVEGGERKTSAAILTKSKKIIDAAAESARRGMVAPPCRNPFPVAHKTSMIERGKKFGLYC